MTKKTHKPSKKRIAYYTQPIEAFHIISRAPREEKEQKKS